MAITPSADIGSVAGNGGVPGFGHGDNALRRSAVGAERDFRAASIVGPAETLQMISALDDDECVVYRQRRGGDISNQVGRARTTGGGDHK